MEQKTEQSFPPMSRSELHEALRKMSNFSAPGPDQVSWFWLKSIIRDESTLEYADDEKSNKLDTVTLILAYYDACVRLGVQPRIFKQSCTVIIAKPKRPDYTKPKAYCPIVLLNCLGKLMEKIIARRLQFDAQKFGLMHPSQFGGSMQHSTQDAGIQLVHNIRQLWEQGIDSSAVLLDVAQFFPSIDHDLLHGILKKQGFNNNLCNYFGDYLKNCQTQFVFNGQTLDPMDFSVGVGQGSSLSPILSGLYIAPTIFKVAPIHDTITLKFDGVSTQINTPWTDKKLQANGHSMVQFFVDDGLLHVGGKLDKSKYAHPLQDQLLYNNMLLGAIYKRIIHHMRRLGLEVESDKLELMHFRRKNSDPYKGHTPSSKGDKRWSSLHPLGPDLKINDEDKSYIIKAKDNMRYLGFWLEPNL